MLPLQRLVVRANISYKYNALISSASINTESLSHRVADTSGTYDDLNRRVVELTLQHKYNQAVIVWERFTSHHPDKSKTKAHSPGMTGKYAAMVAYCNTNKPQKVKALARQLVAQVTQLLMCIYNVWLYCCVLYQLVVSEYLICRDLYDRENIEGLLA